MTQFADITVTDEQIQALNARIAAEKEPHTMTTDTETPFETEEEAHAEYYRLHPQDEGAYTMTTTTQTPIKFDCISNLIHRYERATHGFYFSNDTTRFFSGKYYEPVYRVGDTEVFVDSVRDTWSGQPRQYRVCEWNGSDSTIDRVTEYKTLRSAEKAARRHAESLANQ